MDGADSLVGVCTVDDAGDLDLAGGDHLDVDIVVGQCLEHLGSNAAVALHTSTHDGDLGAGGVHTDIAEVCAVFQHTHGQLGFALGTGKADVLLAVAAEWTAG